MLAAESLKRIDPKTYELYRKFCDEGVSEEEIKNDLHSFYRLKLFLTSVDALDEMEKDGKIKIFNDYDNKEVVVKPYKD